MAKRKNKKNQQALKGLVAVIIIALITILGDKIKLDNINNLVEEVSTNNVVANQVFEDSNEVIDGENVDVYYLDVGQADSILVQSNGMNMLIDAGTNDIGKTVVRDLQALGIKKIDVLIGTHPHEDHIGGLDDVIKNFDIGTIYMPKVQTNTKTFEDVLDAINEKGLGRSKKLATDKSAKSWAPRFKYEFIAEFSRTSKTTNSSNISWKRK